MNNLKQMLEELAEVRDELNLQAHLMKMEARDEWEEFSKSIEHIEQKLGSSLLDLAEKLGMAEEHFFVEDAPTIEALVEDIRDFKQRVKS